jgi:hypothetical protein
MWTSTHILIFLRKEFPKLQKKKLSMDLLCVDEGKELGASVLFNKFYL